MSRLNPFITAGVTNKYPVLRAKLFLCILGIPYHGRKDGCFEPCPNPVLHLTDPAFCVALVDLFNHTPCRLLYPTTLHTQIFSTVLIQSDTPGYLVVHLSELGQCGTIELIQDSTRHFRIRIPLIGTPTLGHFVKAHRDVAAHFPSRSLFSVHVASCPPFSGHFTPFTARLCRSLPTRGVDLVVIRIGGLDGRFDWRK